MPPGIKRREPIHNLKPQSLEPRRLFAARLRDVEWKMNFLLDKVHRVLRHG